MKTISIFIIAMLASTLTFGQVKYQPKVIVVVLGQHNPTLEEASFPDLNFYYTPDLKINMKGIFGKASKNKNKRAWSTALGIGRSAGLESKDSYAGSPEILVEKRIHSGVTYLLDKNGVIAAKSFNGEKEDFNSNMSFIVGFKKLQRKIVAESFGDLLKSMIKKGETAKNTKKTYQDIGEDFFDFKVSDANGNQENMKNLIAGNPATLVFFVYINSEYDLKSARESGKGKKGKTFMNEVAQSVSAERQITPLYNLERGVFGKRLKR